MSLENNTHGKSSETDAKASPDSLLPFDIQDGEAQRKPLPLGQRVRSQEPAPQKELPPILEPTPLSEEEAASIQTPAKENPFHRAAAPSLKPSPVRFVPSVASEEEPEAEVPVEEPAAAPASAPSEASAGIPVEAPAEKPAAATAMKLAPKRAPLYEDNAPEEAAAPQPAAPRQAKPLSAATAPAAKPLAQRLQKPAPHVPRTFSEKEHAAMKQQASKDASAKESLKASSRQKPISQRAKGAVSALQQDSLGSMLQTARERAGLSVPQVEEMTRIKKSYLEALESADVENLPPPVFISAYIRTLSSLYNLTAEEMELVQDKLKEVSPRSEVPETLIHNLEKDGQVNMAEEARVRKMLIGFLCLLALVILWAIGWYFLIKIRNARDLTKAEIAVEASVKPQAAPSAAKEIHPPIGTTSPTFNPVELDRFVFPESMTMSELRMPSQKTAQPAKR